MLTEKLTRSGIKEGARRKERGLDMLEWITNILTYIGIVLYFLLPLVIIGFVDYFIRNTSLRFLDAC